MKKILAAVMSLILLSSCSFGKDNTDMPDDKISVVTSFYAMYDFARLIGGDKVEIYNLSSGEPHDFELSAADIVKIEKSDVFIYNGNNMENWTDKIISTVSGDVLFVETSQGTDILENSDPHTWLDPENAYIQMENICSAFCEKDSKNAEYYKSNLAECKNKIDALDKRYTETAEEGRVLIVSHEAYGYLCDAYGMTQMPLSGLFDEGEASPAKIAEVIEFIKANNIKYIYAENNGNDKTMQIIADDTGAEVLVLSPFESDAEDRTYFEVMQENLEAVSKS